MAGAALGVVASTAAVTKLQSKRLDAGGVLLHNALVGRDDPTSLTRQEVVDIGQRYASQLPSGMCCSKECVDVGNIYSSILDSIQCRYWMSGA